MDDMGVLTHDLRYPRDPADQSDLAASTPSLLLPQGRFERASKLLVIRTQWRWKDESINSGMYRWTVSLDNANLKGHKLTNVVRQRHLVHDTH
jgi:hypothetical protein